MPDSHEVHTITGEFEDVQTRNHFLSGSDDFTGSAEDILDVVTRDGRCFSPQFPGEWTEVAPGIGARKLRGSQQLRIRADACPVRVRFIHVTRYLSSAPEYNTRSSSERLVTYVSGSTTLTDRMVFGLRARLGACRAWTTRAWTGWRA